MYTQQQLERLLGIGEWWNIQFARDRLRNISHANLRELIFSFPRGVEGVQIIKDTYGDNDEFMFVGTAEQRQKRIERSILFLEFEKRKMAYYPVIVEQLDKQLETQRSLLA